MGPRKRYYIHPATMNQASYICYEAIPIFSGFFFDWKYTNLSESQAQRPWELILLPSWLFEFSSYKLICLKSSIEYDRYLGATLPGTLLSYRQRRNRLDDAIQLSTELLILVRWPTTLWLTAPFLKIGWPFPGVIEIRRPAVAEPRIADRGKSSSSTVF